MANRGHPNCCYCGGRGGWMSYKGWRTCRCVKGNRYTARIQREVRERVTGQRQLSMDEMIAMRSTHTKRENE